MRWFLLVIVWLALASIGAPASIAAPSPAKAGRATVASCTEAEATFVVSREVVVQGIPSGRATAWSCASLGAALAELARQEALVRADVAARYGRSDP